MTSAAFTAASIPLAPLLLLGSQAQAETVLSSPDLGSTLLMLEHQYGGVSLDDYCRVSARLEEVKALFRCRVTEMSGPLTKMHSLNFFFERARLFPEGDGSFPMLLSDLLTGKRSRLVPASQSPALWGLTAHLGAVLGARLLFVNTAEAKNGLWSEQEGLLLTFEGKHPELVIMPEAPNGRDLVALVGIYLHALSRAADDAGHASRLLQAARSLYDPHGSTG